MADTKPDGSIYPLDLNNEMIHDDVSEELLKLISTALNGANVSNGVACATLAYMLGDAVAQACGNEEAVCATIMKYAEYAHDLAHAFAKEDYGMGKTKS